MASSQDLRRYFEALYGPAPEVADADIANWAQDPEVAARFAQVQPNISGGATYDQQGNKLPDQTFLTQPQGWDTSTGNLVFNGTPTATTFTSDLASAQNVIAKNKSNDSFGSFLKQVAPYIAAPALFGAGAGALGFTADAVPGITAGGLTSGGTGLGGAYASSGGAMDMLGSGTALQGGGAAATGGAVSGATGGGGMFDFLNPSFNPLDPSTWYGTGADASIPSYNPGVLDPSNFIDPSLNSSYLGAPYQPGFNLLDPSTYGGGSGGIFDNLTSLKNLLSGGAPGTGSGQGGAGGQGFLSSLLGTAAGTIPSALIGNWAMNQKPDLGPLYQTYAGSAANATPFVQAAQTPLMESQAMGYGDLLQSQAARGIRGSSFGDRDIGQYLNTTNRGIANAGTNAAEAALGLQGTLAGRIPQAQSQSLAAIAPILGGSLSGIGQGLRTPSAQNLGQNIASWFPGLFGG